MPARRRCLVGKWFRRQLAKAMAILTVGVVAPAHVTTMTHVMMQAAALGVAS